MTRIGATSSGVPEPDGYTLIHHMMLINGVLGEFVGLETLLNEFSYKMALFEGHGNVKDLHLHIHAGEPATCSGLS